MLEKRLKSKKKCLTRFRAFFDSRNLARLKKKQKNIRGNLGDFLKEQKREVSELASGKQSFGKYCNDAARLFQDYFIPNDNNDNRPKILRPRQLTMIALVLLLIKVSLVVYLFSVYQQTAEMSQTTINQVLILTNEARVAEGSKPLSLNSVLNQAAQAKAEDMVANDYFSHTSPDGRKPWDFVNRSAYPYLLVGENLGMNFIAAGDVHAALMASPSHRKNIINPKYTDIGLAVLSGEIGGEAANILVQIFAYKSEAAMTASTGPSLAEPASSSSGAFVAAAPEQAAVATEPVHQERVVVASEPAVQPEVKTAVKPLIEIASYPDQPQKNATSNNSVVPAGEQEAVISFLEPISLPTENENTQEAVLIEPVSSQSENTFPAPEWLVSNSELAVEPVHVMTSSNQQLSRAARIMQYSRLFYLIFLLLLIIILSINIFIRFAIQHKSVLIQTALLIIMIIALLLLDFSFMKDLKNAATNIVLF